MQYEHTQRAADARQRGVHRLAIGFILALGVAIAWSVA